MPDSRDPLTRTVVLLSAGITSVALLIAAAALFIWVRNPSDRTQPVPAGKGVTAVENTPTAPAPSTGAPTDEAVKVIKASASGQRFSMRLGQGFRFKDGVVVARQDDRPDVVFKYVPPQLGGVELRYNTAKQQLETVPQTPITSPIPLLVSTHASSFDVKPDIARTTSGDMASYGTDAAIGPKTRYVLLQTQGGEQYLLTLDELQAVPGKYDEWRIGFAYEQIQLPMGVAGGKINSPLPGKIIFRDWYRTKMIMCVDLTTGKEEAIADGFLPSAAGGRLLGYVDASNAYIICDAAGRTLGTTRFGDKVPDPLLSPDGTRVVASVERPGPKVPAGQVMIDGPPIHAVAVFDLSGREVAAIPDYDDAAWTPDGKLIATGKLTEAGLFEIDPATKKVKPIDAQMSNPSEVSVSPDGKTIAFVTGDKVWLIDRDGKNLRQLFPDGRAQQRPAFSPDGTKVAIVILNQLANRFTGEVFVIDVKTREPTQLRTNTGMSLMPDTTTRLNWVP